MRYLKHFIKVAGWQIKRNFCKHLDISSASCPFTGMTYTTCEKCGKRINVKLTNITEEK
jgi:hypothetical protein